MENQIRHLYLNNGLNDCKLRNTEDLLRVHKVDFKSINGYIMLDDLNKLLYKKFIVNFFNAQGLLSRTEISPKAIYYVEDKDYLIKENPEDDYYTIVGGIVTAINKNGLKFVIHSWIDEKYDIADLTEEKGKNYLRFEYEYQGRTCWLHVIDEKTWY